MYCKRCGGSDHETSRCSLAVAAIPKRELSSRPASKSVTAMITSSVTKRRNAKTAGPKHCPTCNCQKVYFSNADRQRAYRERRKRSNKGG